MKKQIKKLSSQSISKDQQKKVKGGIQARIAALQSVDKALEMQ